MALTPDGTPPREDPEAEALLRRALLDDAASVAVSLRVGALPVSDAVTVIFHGRRDLGTIQTYVAGGALGRGDTVSTEDLLRVPCDLDLARATDREEAEELYRTQAMAMRDALLSADTVLAVWREPLEDLAGGRVDVRRSVGLDIPLPAPRLMPTTLLARERGIVVAPVCGARTLAEGRPPLGIACAQPDVARIYPLPDDPERCLEDFLALAAEHAHRLEEQIVHQEASIERFLELNED